MSLLRDDLRQEHQQLWYTLTTTAAQNILDIDVKVLARV